MTPEQEQLFLTRAAQCSEAIHEFLSDLRRQGVTVPQQLADALAAFDESMKEGE